MLKRLALCASLDGFSAAPSTTLERRMARSMISFMEEGCKSAVLWRRSSAAGVVEGVGVVGDSSSPLVAR